MTKKKSTLKGTTRARIARLIELSKKKGILVEVAPDETKVILKNSEGEIIASRPVSDFED
jgi:hypothetical protein